MTDLRSRLQGLWLPLVTPFRDGELDDVSLRRLVRHYAALPVNGMILTATTGEGLTLAPEETARLVAIVRDEVSSSGKDLPICLGLSGSDTRVLLDTLRRTAAWPIDGYLISCPYYSRPTQNGMIQHFSALADQAAHLILIYNIPYRTGVNLGNEAMLQLADHHNIVGLKDCCAIRAQSVELLRRRPARFAVLTGEDAQTWDALADGADGAILASAHIETETFASVVRLLTAGDHDAALIRWHTVSDLTKLLFAEPSPAPIKYWLWRTGLIDSPELRLPMTEVSSELAVRLDREIAVRASAAAPAPAGAHCQ
ncbi:4-hydroxy-tetrahydrodipicolinate synthase [Afipia massiliensis]|uniref:4-hydroxy-tetrahydrodipicolinate synthase n=1 Tax=Afipia massiliensis TaxID=211460 RepID=A0A840N282_9BRAD|nr:4-hydroxy-tetrahydrodipicolinate synthase [Afipia massiliensis]MBB5054375.1 4-hydroxy-tetrahydrodipicolinate synthase [Afipia massiliensis]